MTKTRGEEQFVNFPGIAARFYDKLTSIQGIKSQVTKTARYLASQVKEGRLLEVGFGPGRLLGEIYKLNKRIELFGLDISQAMVDLARKNLGDIPATLLKGNINKTDFADDYFDVVTCTGSFYLWDAPQIALDETFRILKDNCSAYLFETHRDYDKDEFLRNMKQNLQGENLLMKMLSPSFLKKQLSMTYSTSEFGGIIAGSKFNKKYEIENVELGNLPVWLRIKLTKNG